MDMDAISGFVKDGVGIIVHTRDFNITAERVALVYRIPKEAVTVVRESEMQELSENMEYISHSPSDITHIGSLSSFVSGIFSCYRLRSAIKTAMVLELICLIIGCGMAVVTAVLGSLLTIGIPTILLFQLVWTAILVAVVALHRY